MPLYSQIEITCPRCGGTGDDPDGGGLTCTQCEGSLVSVAPDVHNETVFRLIDVLAKLELIWNKVK